MKKTVAALLAALTLMFTAACTPQSPEPPPPAPGGQLLAGGSTDAPPPLPNTETALTLLSPGNETALDDTLAALAQADGNRLIPQKLAAGSGYMEGLAQALTSDNAPDLFWIPDEESLWAAVGLGLCANLAGDTSAPMRALAGLLPANSFVSPGTGVYGLPAGYTAQGNVINLALLAVLLGTQNLPQLRADVAACTAAQWGAMVLALDTYLQKPGVMQIHLDKNTYTTPGYRPRQAQGLRGIYAIGGDTALMFAKSAVSTAYAAAFASWQEEAGMDALDKARRLVPALASMGGLFDIESMYMASPGGPLRRGDDFANSDTLSDREAAVLFAGGTALVMRADLQTALNLQDEHPQLAGQLALVPLKLPALPEEELDDTQNGDTAGEDATGEAGSVADDSATLGEDAPDTDAAQPDAAAEDPTAPLGEDAPDTDAAQPDTDPEDSTAPRRDLAAAIEANNSLLLYDIPGYLCVNANSDNRDAAFSLLLRLYTTEAGRAAYLKATGRPLFGVPAYTNSLANAVCLAIAEGGGMRAVISGTALASGEAQIAAIVREQLLPVSAWSTEVETTFLVSCLQALGFEWNAA